MTRREAQQLVAHMAAAWPHVNVSAATVAIWSEHLIDLDYEAGLEAVQACERGLKYFPTVAEFLDAYQPIRRRRVETERRPELAAGPSDPSIAQRYRAEIRRTLNRARGPLAAGLIDELDPPEPADA